MKATPLEIKWHSGLPVFASEAFLKAVGDEYGWLGGIDASGQLRCILPYTVVRKAFFRMVRFRVETIPCGDDLEVGQEKSFLDSAMEFFRSAGADMVIPGTNTTLFRTFPEGAVVAPYGTYLIDLSQTEEELWRDVRSDFKGKIRKAEKAGVRITSGMEYLDSAYAFIKDTMGRSSLRFRGRDDFMRMMHSLGENVKVFAVEYKGQLQGCMVAPFSEHTAYSLYSGRAPETANGAMHLLRWEAILCFHRMGVKHFNNTGVRVNPEKGSKQDGLTNFKMRFGGRFVRGYMWKHALRPLPFAVYCLGVRLLRGGDIVDHEHHNLDSEQPLRSAVNR